MVSADMIVAEARSWVGTPFRHQQRAKGHGVDCIGLVVGVARALGLPLQDRTDYARMPDGVTLGAELARQFDAVAEADMRPGDVLLFAMSKLPRHVAIYVGEVDGHPRMVHATSLVDKCVEVTLDKTWRHALRGVYRYRGAV